MTSVDPCTPIIESYYYLPTVEIYASPSEAIVQTSEKAKEKVENLAFKFGAETTAKLKTLIRALENEAQSKINRLAKDCKHKATQLVTASAQGSSKCETAIDRSWEIATDMRNLCFTLLDDANKQATAERLKAHHDKIKAASFFDKVTPLQVGLTAVTGEVVFHGISMGVAKKQEITAAKALAKAERLMSSANLELDLAETVHKYTKQGSSDVVRFRENLRIATSNQELATSQLDKAKRRHTRKERLLQAATSKPAKVLEKSLIKGAVAVATYGVLKLAGGAVNLLLGSDELANGELREGDIKTSKTSASP